MTRGTERCRYPQSLSGVFRQLTVEISPLHQKPSDGEGGIIGVIAFYEKVIKVKADVAAFLINLLSICITLRWVTWGAVKGASNRGVHLDP
jgi:hypothetical protein